EPSVTALLDTIDANAQRGANVLQQLLRFGRGTSRERVPVRLSALVDEVGAIVRHTFPKAITNLIEERDQDVYVVADPTQLHQVLMNLCVNARDAMLLGGALHLRVWQACVDPAQA